MQLKITKADSHGPGCAWLEISAAVPAGVTFRLTCLNSLKPHLGPQGWQSAPYEIQPRSIVPTRTGTRMLVGPEVVDKIEEDVRVTLEIPATGYTASAIWPDIPVSGVRYQATLDGPSGPQALPPLPSRIGGTENPTQKPPPPAESEEEDRRDRIEGLHPVRDHQTIWHRISLPTSRNSILSLASLAFLVSAAIGYTAMDWPRTAAADRAAMAPGTEAGEATRLMLERSPEPDRLFRVGLQLHQTPGAARDLGLQAIQRAAEYDHAPAILWLGRIFDPSENGLAGAVREPNIAEAARAYSRAARLGETRARELLGTACGELRRKAVSEAEVQAKGRFC
jgi:hypothetical protein